ncbi:MAG: DUF3262 family protein [Gammaproteobacteria bacterium]
MVTAVEMNAFSAAAGVSLNQISLLVRTILSAIFLLWAAWNVYGQLQLMQNNALDIHDFPMSILRILFLCALMVIVVFVS